MKNELKVGIVVADSDEYAPIKDKIAELGAKKADFYAREGLSFEFKEKDKTVKVHIVNCGVGMVNAATVTTALCLEGCEVILNAGLSGGISGISRGELMLATDCIEHPHYLARNNFIKLKDHTNGTEVTDFCTVPHFSVSKIDYTKYEGAPILGEHTDEILAKVLGYSEEKIDELKKADAVRASLITK